MSTEKDACFHSPELCSERIVCFVAEHTSSLVRVLPQYPWWVAPRDHRLLAYLCSFPHTSHTSFQGAQTTCSASPTVKRVRDNLRVRMAHSSSAMF